MRQQKQRPPPVSARRVNLQLSPTSQFPPAVPCLIPPSSPAQGPGYPRRVRPAQDAILWHRMQFRRRTSKRVLPYGFVGSPSAAQRSSPPPGMFHVKQLFEELRPGGLGRDTRFGQSAAAPDPVHLFSPLWHRYVTAVTTAVRPHIAFHAPPPRKAPFLWNSSMTAAPAGR